MVEIDQEGGLIIKIMKKANKKRNPVAKQLRHFKQKVVKNKKAYDRKKNFRIEAEIVNGNVLRV